MSTTTLVVLSVLEIVVLVAALAFYLAWVGVLLSRIADNLEDCNASVKTIIGHAGLIGPGVQHINETGAQVAGAMPLLYGLAEGIIAKATPAPAPSPNTPVARPASGTRRSRMHVGYAPPQG
ncbi:MAG: hypothetical protein ACRD0K_15635 [Egibacteraceae bacterium]